MEFTIVGMVTDVETIASGSGVRSRKRLSKRFGRGRWRKMKGIATVRLEDESFHRAEVHWYEAHGIGKTGWKIKRFLD